MQGRSAGRYVGGRPGEESRRRARLAGTKVVLLLFDGFLLGQVLLAWGQRPDGELWNGLGVRLFIGLLAASLPAGLLALWGLVRGRPLRGALLFWALFLISAGVALGLSGRPFDPRSGGALLAMLASLGLLAVAVRVMVQGFVHDVRGKLRGQRTVFRTAAALFGGAGLGMLMAWSPRLGGGVVAALGGVVLMSPLVHLAVGFLGRRALLSGCGPPGSSFERGRRTLRALALFLPFGGLVAPAWVPGPSPLQLLPRGARALRISRVRRHWRRVSGSLRMLRQRAFWTTLESAAPAMGTGTLALLALLTLEVDLSLAGVLPEAIPGLRRPLSGGLPLLISFGVVWGLGTWGFGHFMTPGGGFRRSVSWYSVLHSVFCGFPAVGLLAFLDGVREGPRARSGDACLRWAPAPLDLSSGRSIPAFRRPRPPVGWFFGWFFGSVAVLGWLVLALAATPVPFGAWALTTVAVCLRLAGMVATLLARRVRAFASLEEWQRVLRRGAPILWWLPVVGGFCALFVVLVDGPGERWRQRALVRDAFRSGSQTKRLPSWRKSEEGLAARWTGPGGTR